VKKKGRARDKKEGKREVDIRALMGKIQKGQEQEMI